MEGVEFVNINILDDTEKEILNRLTEKHHEKIKRLLGNISSVVLHLKEYKNSKKEIKKRKYSISVRIIAPGAYFESSAFNWKLDKALNEVFTKIEREIQHKFHKASVS